MEGSGDSGRGSREPGRGRHKELGLEPTVRGIRRRNKDKGPGKGRLKDLGQATVTDIRLRQGRHKDKGPGQGRHKGLGLATVSILLHLPRPPHPPRLQLRASLRA